MDDAEFSDFPDEGMGVEQPAQASAPQGQDTQPAPAPVAQAPQQEAPPAVPSLFVVAEEQDAKPMIETKEGNVYPCAVQDYGNTHPSREDFHCVLEHLQKLTNVEDIKYNRWVFMEFAGEAQAPLLFNRLLDGQCDIVGMNHIGMSSYTAVCRRINVRKKLNLTGLSITGFFVVKAHGMRHGDAQSLYVKMLKAWLNAGLVVRANFEVRDPTIFNSEALDREWASLTAEECDWQIIQSREKKALKRRLTERDIVILTNGERLLARRRMESNNRSSLKFLANDPETMPLCQFIELDHIIIKTFCPVSGAPLQWSVQQFMDQKLYLKYCLSLLGDSSLGKTALAVAMASEMACILQASSQQEPFVIKLGTVDALREAKADNLLHVGVPIVWDELKPGEKRGTRPPQSIEEVKKMCETELTSTLNLRNVDITIACPQPRIFTSNALTPNAWHPELPLGVFEMTESQKKGLSADIKAVFKRVAFGVVSRSVISEADRLAFGARRTASAGASSSGA